MDVPDMQRADVPAEVNRITGSIVKAAFDVHSHLGPSLLESGYEECLEAELADRGHSVLTQVSVPLIYKGRRMGASFRLDMLVDDTVIVEVKAVDALHLIHFAQLMTYLKLARKPVGLLINFNVVHLRHGVRRVVGPAAPSFRVPRVLRVDQQGD